ncbi:MAG: ring-cleaving dioxygenase [Opitutaceae bacterium]|nr:ring-cleaving dioxygenase [Opitutaceae bacterium]
MKSTTPSPTSESLVTSPVAGIHHVTAVASDPRRNIAFYSGVLGLRLVKKTVNFDDPSAYHLYYGDASGTPGSIVTFFYWPDFSGRGRVGAGQTTALSFSAPAGSLGAWSKRLQEKGVASQHAIRFGEEVLTLRDPDGILVELVAVSDDTRSGWTGGDVPTEMALRGLHTAVLTVRDATPTEALLTKDMGYRLVRREGNRARFEAGPGGSGRLTDVLADASAPNGTGGVGTIHHIAWRVADDESQQRMQARLMAAGFMVSPMRDRQYFRSIYYRERGGILFEIATDVPGFAVDEPAATLGQALKLPPQFESARTEIEHALPSLT